MMWYVTQCNLVQRFSNIFASVILNQT